MTLGFAAIIAAYVAVALVLLVLALHSRWHWPIKAAIVVVTSAAYVVTYAALPRLLGWPTDRGVPAKFGLLAVYIQDPDEQNGAPGSVFFWASDLAPGADNRPRAYRLPFTPEFKAVFQEANGKLRQNIPQVGEIELDDQPHGVPLDRSRLGQKSVKIKLRDAPVDLPPSKDAVVQ